MIGVIAADGALRRRVEMKVYTRLPELLAGVERPVIIEIGAHYGQDTVELRRLFPGARLWAFEPDPRNVYMLKKHGITSLATVVEAAIGDREGAAEMRLSSGAPPKGDPMYLPNQPREWSYSSSLKRPVKHLERVPWVKFDRRATVAVTTLDAFAAREGLEVIDFIWADVQGAEDQMIAGGQAALARTKYLYTEYDDEEVYEGQIGLAEIIRRLPGRWEVMEDYGQDALLRNATVRDGRAKGGGA